MKLRDVGTAVEECFIRLGELDPPPRELHVAGNATLRARILFGADKL